MIKKKLTQIGKTLTVEFRYFNNIDPILSYNFFKKLIISFLLKLVGVKAYRHLKIKFYGNYFKNYPNSTY